MHQEVKDYISKVKEKMPEFFKGKRVLEMGSLNYNGTPRDYFEDCEYIGLDWMAGDKVDVVCKAHEYKSDEKFDVVITTEMLEHDAYAKESIFNGYRLLKKGGVLIATCANVNREPHYEFTGENEHYKNVSREDVKQWALELGASYEVEEDENKMDIRFLLWK